MRANGAIHRYLASPLVGLVRLVGGVLLASSGVRLIVAGGLYGHTYLDHLGSVMILLGVYLVILALRPRQ
jgi:hypothetical protein